MCEFILCLLECTGQDVLFDVLSSIGSVTSHFIIHCVCVCVPLMTSTLPDQLSPFLLCPSPVSLLSLPLLNIYSEIKDCFWPYLPDVPLYTGVSGSCLQSLTGPKVFGFERNLCSRKGAFLQEA